jgi:5-methylcytosine-specific restriction endonuclease McrA
MVEIMTSCITCGVLIPLGTSRCKAHGGQAWSGKPAGRQSAYRDPVYKANRKTVIEREPRCHWGLRGCTGKSTTADHLIAVAQGGSNELSNLVGACARCNAARGASLGGQTTKSRRRQMNKTANNV